MKKYINFLLLWLLAFSSCVDEEIISNVKEGEDVTVSLNLYLPNPSQITTRAITSTEEAKVEVLKILVFDNKGNYLPERSVSSVKVESSEQTVDDNGGSLIAKKIPMQMANDNLSLVVLANVVNEGETNDGTLTTIPQIQINDTKSSYLARLAYTVNEKWNATSTENYRRFPMWGEYTGQISATPIEVDLLRALARINVSFSEDASSNFTLTSIRVNNSLSNGLIVPDSRLQDKNVITPTLPASPNVNPSLVYEGDAVNNNTCINEIYIPEAGKSTSSISYDGVYLTMAGEIGGVDKLYRVYMTNTGKVGGTALDILRNHTYKVHVSKIGAGENDITVNIEEMSDVYIRSPYEQNTLAVSSNLFYFNIGQQAPANLNITTTWGEWKIVDAMLDGFTITENHESNSVVISPSGFNKLASGYFFVQSGQLKKKILVKIDPEETANCYIRSESGTYPLNISVKGNGREGMIADGKQLLTEEELKLKPSKIGIIWETSEGLVRLDNGNGVYDQTSVQVDPDNDFSGVVNYHVDIDKTPKKKGGNALIGAFNSANECIWSWHIWVVPGGITTENWGGNSKDYTFMDRYIGALSNNPGNDALGLLYQWGRKDPFIGAAGPQNQVRQNTYNYQPCGSGTRTYTWGVTETTSLAQSIKFPTDLLKTGLCNVDQNGTYLWGTPSGMEMYSGSAVNEGNKTVYDPCPVGYRVPPLLAYLFHSDENYKNNYNGNNYYIPSGSNYSDNASHYGFWINYIANSRPSVTNSSVSATNSTWFPLAGVYDPKNMNVGENVNYSFSEVDDQNSLKVNSIVWTNTPIKYGKNGDDFRPGAMFLHGTEYGNTRNGRHLHKFIETSYDLYAQTQFAGSVRCVKIQESQDFSQLNEFPERIILDAAEGSKKSATIKVINETWEVINPGAPWFYLDKYSGDPDGGAGQTLVFTASEENAGAQREATLIVKTSKGSEYSIKVVQKVASYTFEASPNKLTFDWNPSNSQDITVTNSKYDWSVQSGYAEWLTVKRNGNRLTVSASKNSTWYQRNTAVTLKDSNGETISIAVTQNGRW